MAELLFIGIYCVDIFLHWCVGAFTHLLACSLTHPLTHAGMPSASGTFWTSDGVLACFEVCWRPARALMYMRGRDMFFAISTVICLADWLLCYAFQWYSVFRVSRLLRPVLLIRCVSTSAVSPLHTDAPCVVTSKKKTLRRLAAVMVRTFPKMVDVAGVFFTALAVYAVLGAQLFNNDHIPENPYGYQSNNDNYNNVGHAALAMYIFTTTEVSRVVGVKANVCASRC